MQLCPVHKFLSEINMLSAISACDNTTNGEQPLLEFLRKAGPPIYPNAQDQSSSDAEQEKIELFIFKQHDFRSPTRSFQEKGNEQRQMTLCSLMRLLKYLAGLLWPAGSSRKLSFLSSAALISLQLSAVVYHILLGFEVTSWLVPAEGLEGRSFHQPVLLASPVPMCRKLRFITAEAELLTELQEGTPIAGTANGREQSVHPLSFYTLKNIPVQQAEWMNPPAAHSARETNGKTKAASKTGVAEQKEIELAAPQHSGRVLERAKKSTIIGPLS